MTPKGNIKSGRAHKRLHHMLLVDAQNNSIMLQIDTYHMARLAKRECKDPLEIRLGQKVYGFVCVV
jgi:hypothetical protein